MRNPQPIFDAIEQLTAERDALQVAVNDLLDELEKYYAADGDIPYLIEQHGHLRTKP